MGLNDRSINGSSHLPAMNGVDDQKGTMPIAICGMALRLPGGLSSPKEFWDFLLAKGDGRCRVPKSRYNVEAYHSPDQGKPGFVATEHGFFLDESVDLGALDTSFFSMTRTEVERADPQQRLLLEVSRECFEDAGEMNYRGKTIGCYVGSLGEDWLDMFYKEPLMYGIHRLTAGDFALSNRVSYEMDLQGPSMTIRTACSAALMCLNEACVAISRGDCESAIVGGVNLILNQTTTISMTEQGLLSKDGSCKSFSADANGYARGEAVTAIFIKPLADAIRDGNPIRAVIRATADNSDGKTNGLTQPSTEAQVKLMKRAYEVAGITDYRDTAVVECHGTGTPIGDPIETKAVARVFGDEGVYITSVKPNLGHAEGASGLVSIIKMVLALENKTIPPNIRFNTPNPNIPFESAKLTVPLEPTPWPAGRLERVSVNSFGIGGANAHVILDSAASFNQGPNFSPSAPITGSQLLLHSANSANSLQKLVNTYSTFAQEHPDKVGDLAYTLAFRREPLPHRSFTIAKDGSVGLPSTAVKPSGSLPPSVVMVFTGQGAQWPLMGKQLLKSNPVFQASVRALDKILQSIDGEDAPKYFIEEELLKAGKSSRVGMATLSQPLCTAIQIALVDTLNSLGIVPAAVVGHSSGEIGAAYASGGLTAREAILVAHFRGVAASRQQRAGGMAAIGMSWGETEKFLISGTTLACDNSPNSVTISGDVEAVRSVVSNIKNANPDVLAKLLQVDKAYHSDHMVEVGDYYLACLHRHVVTGRTPTKAQFISSVSGGFTDGTLDLGAAYWRKNLESPVRFREAVSSILQDKTLGGSSLFMEVGPHSALAGPLRQIFTSISSSSTTPYVATLVRNQDCQESVLTTAGKLWSLNVPLNLEPLIPKGQTLGDLPRYPWNHEGSYWFESRISQHWRNRPFPHHDLLGSRIPESTDSEPVWLNLFHIQNAPWIQDHRVNGDTIFPFAGFIAMAGEAISQITGIRDGFSIRKMTVSLACILPEGKPHEMVTVLRPVRLTKSLNSQWWEFTVSSHNGQTWSQHSTGEIMANSASPTEDPNPTTSLPRKVPASSWYGTLRKQGLDLGSTFQSMQTIDVAPTAPGNDAISRIEMAPSNTQPGTGYHIHPTMVDGLLQLLSCAAINGQDRKAKLWLPTSIENLTMKRCSEAITAHVSGDITSNGSIHGHGTFTSNGKIFLQASGIHLALGNGSDSNSMSDTHAAARYTWGPDIDFIDIDVLAKTPVDRGSEIALLDHLTTLFLGCSQPDGSMSRPPSTHLKSYAQWISKQVRTGTSGTSTPTDQDIVLESLEEWAKRLSCKPAAAAVLALQDVFSNLPAILRGDYVSSGGLREGIRADLSRFTNSFDTSSLVKHVCHSKPNLRVLEIGQDAPRPSSLITESLSLSNGEIMCSQYTFTTKSYTSTTNQDTPFPAMEFLTLDISKDLEEEGFTDRQYDLIVFPNVVGSTSISPPVLQNIKNLLAPEGRLVLQIINTDSVWARYVFGSQPSWWLGSPSDDDHLQGDYVDALQRSLFSSGLGRVDCVAEDGISTTVITRPTEKKILAKKVSVLYTDPDEVERREDPIVLQLEGAGYQLTKSSLSNPNLPPGQDVICLLDRASPFFETLLAEQLEMLRMLVTKLEGAGLFWVTEHCQMGVKDPRYAPVIGFARTMRTEMLVDFATCEIEDWLRDVPLLVKVFQKFQSRNQVEDDFKPELEFSIKEGQVHIGRYYPFSLPTESSSLSGSENYILDVETPGRITSLQFGPSPRTTPAEGEIEFEVAATGLSFRDVLIAMNIVELPVRRFGPEASGIVTRVGPGVTDFKVGDRIVASVFAGFKKYVCVPAFGCVQLPDSIDFIEASSLLIPYITAIYSLINIGRLTEGQSVLIHSACGGVGLAALMIAQMLKADIYTSVGSEEKVQYLHKEFGLPLNRILHSRDDSFVADVMRETNGRGVDLVLNSLSGELLHATWNCVAAFGTMVEIGKRDLIGNGKLDMRPFLANRNYSCVDIDHFWRKPTLLKHLVTSIVKYRHEGHIRAMPVKLFPASEVREAFRYMQKGQHIGRVSVAMRDDLVDEKFTIEVVPRPLETIFNGSASYLLVGGLGGLGRAVSRWMVEQGARELIYLSRSAQKTGDTAVFVEELQATGCHIQLVAGDVTKPEDVVRAVTAASQPLKGIIQLSMVLRDENFESMTIEDWNAAVAPKVKGTWNLHNATKNNSLDFFLLFSSISGAVGQPGQANYASANTFLDAFVQYRESLGLVASVIDIGAVADIGVITQTRGLMSKMKSTGFKGVEEQELLDAIDLAIAQGRTRTREKDSHSSLSWSNQSTFVLGLGSDTPLKSSSNRTVWRNDRRMAIYHNKSGTSGPSDATTSSNQALKAAIAGALADSSTLKSTDFGQYLATEIGKKLFDLLLKPYDDLNTARPLVDLGLDSLVAIELRAWWKQMFGFDISVLEMLGMGSLHALGQRAVEGLSESAGGAE